MMEAEPGEDVALQALLVGKTRAKDEAKALFPICVASYGLLLWNLLYASMVPLMPAYAEELGLTSQQQATVLAALQVGWLVGLPILLVLPAGKRLLYLGGFLHVLAPAVLLLFPPTFGLFVFVRGLEGVGSCFVTVLLDAMLMRQLPQSMRGRGIAVRTAIGTIGLLGGPLVGGFVMPRYGLPGVLTLLMLAGAVGLALYSRVPEDWLYDGHAAQLSLQARGFGLYLPCITGEWFKAGVLFALLPSQMFQVLHYDTFALSCAWLRWDTLKVLATLVGGWLADRAEPAQVVFPCLFAAPVILCAVGAQSGGGVFESLVGMLFVCGTTQGAGLLGPSFVKLLVSKTPPGVGFVRMFTAVDLCITLGIGAGNLAAGAAWGALGFANCLYALAALQLAMACGTFHAHNLQQPAQDHLACE